MSLLLNVGDSCNCSYSYPSPENGIPVVSVGEYDTETGKYKIPVTARGKNLFDVSKIISNSSVTNNGDGTIVTKVGAGNAGAPYTLHDYCPELKVGDTVILNYSMRSDGGDINNANKIYLYGANVAWFIGTSKVITQSMLDSRVAWYPAKDSDGNSYDATISNIQLETGTTATEYEPYHAPIQTTLYLDEPLRSQYQQTESKWYCDEINFKTNILIRNLSEKTFVGTANENWKYSKETDEKIYFLMTGFLNNCSFGKDSVMCDRFVASYVYATNITSTAEGISVAYSTNTIYLSIFKSRLTDAGLTVDLDGFKTWLSQNPVTITYILKESTEETISLPKLPTIKGTTIYEIGTSLNASNMEATYYSTVKGE